MAELNEFQAFTKEDWILKIEKDLKGKSYSSLTSQFQDLSIEATYSSDSNPASSNNQAFKTTPEWNIAQEILVIDEKEANKKCLDILNKGANSLSLYLESDCNLEIILKDILIQHINIDFISNDRAQITESKIKDLCAKRDLNIADLSYSINRDPIENLARTANWFSSEEDDFNDLSTLNNSRNNRNFCINTSLFENAGASISLQLAIALASAYEHIHRLNLKDASNFQFNLSIGSEYFPEIAKVRALRNLWSLLLSEVKIADSPAHIYAENSMRNKSLLDIYNNMIRSTAENMAGVIGGVDSFCSKAFNELDKSNSFGERIARNQQLVLASEAQFMRQMDMSKNSFFIEHLTAQLEENAWLKFKDIEAKGGIVECLKSAYLQDQISKEATEEQAKFDSGEKVLIGVNKFANSEDSIPSKPSKNRTSESGVIKRITPSRLAESMEQKNSSNG